MKLSPKTREHLERDGYALVDGATHKLNRLVAAAKSEPTTRDAYLVDRTTGIPAYTRPPGAVIVSTSAMIVTTSCLMSQEEILARVRDSVAALDPPVD